MAQGEAKLQDIKMSEAQRMQMIEMSEAQRMQAATAQGRAYEFEANSFVIDPFDFADGEDKGEVVGVLHSHPQNVLEFSPEDIKSCNSIQIPFYLVCPDLDKMIVIEPEEDA